MGLQSCNWWWSISKLSKGFHYQGVFVANGWKIEWHLRLLLWKGSNCLSWECLVNFSLRLIDWVTVKVLISSVMRITVTWECRFFAQIFNGYLLFTTILRIWGLAVDTAFLLRLIGARSETQWCLLRSINCIRFCLVKFLIRLLNNNNNRRTDLLFGLSCQTFTVWCGWSLATQLILLCVLV